MKGYHQLAYTERCLIFEELKQSASLGMIAKKIGRAKSTISRELKRNGDHIGYFYPSAAEVSAKKRKARLGPKVARHVELEKYVYEKLSEGWAPDVIAAKWNSKKNDVSISKEAIYAYIYSEIGRKKGLPQLLPRSKKKRGVTRKQKTASHIPERVSMDKRPDSINLRTEVGHFEGDLMFYKGSMSQNVTSLSERTTKYAMFIKNDSKSSEAIIRGISIRLDGIAKSITFDNGLEFARHTILRNQYNIDTYFCRPAAPYEKGGIENLNNLSRRWIPFDEPLENITQEKLDWMQHKLNHIPRKSLGYLTPCEAFSKSFQNVNLTCCTS